MDRFEDNLVNKGFCLFFNLHSSMDRFEVLSRKFLIYLKKYLHSSMDRFEGWLQSISNKKISIYIPVWIDLKMPNFKRLLLRVIIYIPVWIDLKIWFLLIWKAIQSNLHSSMDRFEGLSMFFLIVKNRNLHSSMDRFEVTSHSMSDMI